ncbi:MAG: hydroxymethylbilane synthase [Bacteroidetes bacterium]|nr:hydroxymethylbilane synthase [Bacteroidota bacterium]
MRKVVRIGTRESQLALWQATQVKNLLASYEIAAELVHIKSEGDIDLKTPLYEMGVQGIFTRSLDIALLNKKIDIAVHSMKDVPTQLPVGIAQAAVLKRGNTKDLLVYKGEKEKLNSRLSLTDKHDPQQKPASFIIATSSIRRKAQWLHRYPNHTIENLRGNVNTRMVKLKENNWDAAIFAAAGLERIGLRPDHSVELDWMLPAPSQGAIMIVCREEDNESLDICESVNDGNTKLCTKIERDFLRTLLGGCSTPIAALAEVEEDELYFRGNILTPDGSKKAEIEKILPLDKVMGLGKEAAEELLLSDEGQDIIQTIRNAKK